MVYAREWPQIKVYSAQWRAPGLGYMYSLIELNGGHRGPNRSGSCAGLDSFYVRLPLFIRR